MIPSHYSSKSNSKEARASFTSTPYTIHSFAFLYSLNADITINSQEVNTKLANIPLMSLEAP